MASDVVKIVKLSWSSLGPSPRRWDLKACPIHEPTEFIKRLAAASGIDYLNLIKSPETMAQEGQQAKQDAMTQQLVGQAGQLAKSPMAEQLMEQMQ